jgi:AraC family transcriptional regulator, regulatory protein of adaptative response / methylated-DNA-[protein]-cysteine methyltransferase
MIITAKIDTVLGTMIGGVVPEGICLLEFADRKILQKEYNDLERYFKTSVRDGENRLLIILIKQLKEYFEGSRKNFTIPIATPGTPFQQSVWKELMNIPYGETRTYLNQSVALGKPESVRAVAGANGLNRIAIIIPCHRVIGSDGNLTGYGGGLTRKKWLLDHEKKYSGKPSELSLF